MERLVLFPAEAFCQVGAIQLCALAQQAGKFGVTQGLAAQQMATVLVAGPVFIGATAFLAAGQGEQTMPKIVAKTHGGQGVQFA